MIARKITVWLTAMTLTLVALGSAARPVAAGFPTAHNYPGCGATIQDCVNSAAPGDGIFVHADDAGTAVSISKELLLTSGDGVKHTIGFIAIGDLSTTPIHVIVDGFNVSTAVRVFFDQSVGSRVEIRNVVAHGSSVNAPFDFLIERSATVALERSAGSPSGSIGDAMRILASPNGGHVSFRIVGNSLSGHGHANSGAGIALTMMGTGRVTADIFNNTIWDVARCGCGFAAGIGIIARDTVLADVNIVGNTIERSATKGLEQRNNLATGGHLGLDVFNNIFAHTGQQGIALDSGNASLTYRGGYNDSFVNGSPNDLAGQAPGPGNVSIDPRFVDRAAGKLGLKSTSGLIDKGQVCSPGGVANPDAAGRHRIAAKSIDIGALERGAGAVTGIILLGTPANDTQIGSAGSDILCGFSGADTQRGLGGNDYLDGGVAADRLDGGPGADRLFGRDSNDLLCANDGSGNDLVNGGTGTDRFRADAGDTRKSVEKAGACPF